MYILRPHAAGILYPPPFYTPPTPRRVFSGVGGWGCIKFGPVFFWKISRLNSAKFSCFSSASPSVAFAASFFAVFLGAPFAHKKRNSVASRRVLRGFSEK